MKIPKKEVIKVALTLLLFVLVVGVGYAAPMNILNKVMTPELHAQCAQWVYVNTGNEKDSRVIYHMNKVGNKMAPMQIMYYQGIAEGYATGIAKMKGDSPQGVSQDLYDELCSQQEA